MLQELSSVWELFLSLSFGSLQMVVFWSLDEDGHLICISCLSGVNVTKVLDKRLILFCFQHASIQNQGFLSKPLPHAQTRISILHLIILHLVIDLSMGLPLMFNNVKQLNSLSNHICVLQKLQSLLILVLLFIIVHCFEDSQAAHHRIALLFIRGSIKQVFEKHWNHVHIFRWFDCKMYLNKKMLPR
jgi:hypothetical protein